VSPATFRRNAERIFRAANPGAQVDKWVHGPVRVTWADGSKGVSGVMACSGAGYRPRAVVATLHNDGVMVR
jgi:hypothetical protein